MDASKIQEFKKKLIIERKEMQNQLHSLQIDKQRNGIALPADWSEQVVEKENDEVIDALSNLDSDKVEKIDAALERINADTFGVCMNCGEEINEKRLDAVTYAATCIKCS